jgi:hypothetical protein
MIKIAQSFEIELNKMAQEDDSFGLGPRGMFSLPNTAGPVNDAPGGTSGEIVSPGENININLKDYEVILDRAKKLKKKKRDGSMRHISFEAR